jgi:hypothetical protein
MSYVRESGSHPFYTHQTDARLAQAAAVQNTWYTVLDTIGYVRILSFQVLMATATETIEGRITVDGVVVAVGAAALTFGTAYCAVFNNYTDANTMVWDQNLARYNPILLEGKSVKVEMRKTTAAGLNTLTGRVVYAKRL